MRKTLTYAIDVHSGQIISRIGSEVAIPVLDYEDMTPENNFIAGSTLTKFPVFAIVNVWDNFEWTRKIPAEIKNIHRQFWGMKPLKN